MKFERLTLLACVGVLVGCPEHSAVRLTLRTSVSPVAVVDDEVSGDSRPTPTSEGRRHLPSRPSSHPRE